MAVLTPPPRTPLVPLAGASAPDVVAAVRRMLDGGPALGLGVAEPGLVPEGAGAVVVTSGSTGIPKRVLLGRRALIASAHATAARIGEGAWLLALPAGYVAGLQVIVRSLLAGPGPVLLPAGHFDPRAFAALAHAARPEFTSLVPAQLIRLLDAADTDTRVVAALRSFRAVLVGGQALPEPVADRARRAGARIVRTYGATETCGGCVYDGVALDGVDVAIAGGEVRLGGPTLADGYLAEDGALDAVATARVFVRDETGARRYRTGDGGRVQGGVLQVTGRLDNVIVSGGVNVSLDAVERAVRGVAGLAEAIVVGVPDPRWGEASVVVAAGVADAVRALADARRAVADAVGEPARPSRLVALERVPLLAGGKPDRRRARREALRELRLD